jgi:hypothetical protein
MNDNDTADENSMAEVPLASMPVDTDTVPVGIRASDDFILRQQAREALRSGRLPRARPESVWAGPGSGASCAICGKRVKGDQLGFELDFYRGGKTDAPITSHVHYPCFTAWEFECQGILQVADEDGTIYGRERDTAFKRGQP